MFFDDKKYKNKMDLGNKKVENKDEFLKKLREEKLNEQKKNKQIENNMKIKKFLNFLKNKISPSEILNKNLKNLKTTKALLDHKKDFDRMTIDKILENTFEKLNDDLKKIYVWNIKNTEELSHLIINLLLKFSNDKLLAFLVTNKSLILNIYINSIIHLYSLIKKDYLIEEKLSFFAVNKLLENLKNFDIFSFIFKSLARKESVIYFLNTILKFSKKLIGDVTKKEVMNTIIELNRYVVFSEKDIYQNFYENSLKFIFNLKEYYNPDSRIIFTILCKCSNNIIFKFFTETDFVFIANNISEEMLNNEIRNFYLFSYEKKDSKNILNIIEMLFYHYRKIDFKNNKDKTRILSCVNTIIEFALEFYSKIGKKILNKIELLNINSDFHNTNKNNYTNLFNKKNSNLIEIDNVSFSENSKNQNLNINPDNHSANNTYFNNQNPNIFAKQENFRDLINEECTEKLILIIYQSAKLIKKLYEENFDNSNLISLLDFIINKQAIKTNEGIINTILLFSLKFLDYKNEKINIHNFDMKKLNKFLQVISFCVYSRIEYRENFFFIEFKNSWNIYQNIPFNYVYLNNLTKLLIHAFSYFINKKDIEYIEKLTDNVIIHCLKSLYNLDSEIQFSQSKDNYWSNMELISKIQKFSQKKLIQAMKIMPFIFPFVYRLTFLNNHLKSLKKSVQTNNLYNAYHNDSDDDYNSNNYNMNVSFSVKRNRIFEETFGLYIENKLRPFAKWKVTFINEFGMKEEGGKIF